MKVVLDTSAWYGYIFSDDSFHHQAKSFLTKFKPDLITPYPVLEELAAIAHHRKGKSPVMTYVFKPLLQSRHNQTVYLSPQADHQIWDIYQQTPAKIDYVDASVIWLSRKLDLPIFTFDRHFRNLDLNLVPSPW